MRLTAFTPFIAASSFSACVTSIETKEVSNSQCDDIWTVEAITVQADKGALAQKYYELAWLPARVQAKTDKVIKDFALIRTDEPNAPQIQLVTIYENDAQYAQREAAFRSIFDGMDLPDQLTVDGLTRNEIIAKTEGASGYRHIGSQIGPCEP